MSLASCAEMLERIPRPDNGTGDVSGDTDGETHLHSFGEWYGNTATCTAGGTEKRDCTSCEHSESKDTAELGHTWRRNNACGIF